MTSTVLIEVSEDNADQTRLDQLSRQLLIDLRRHGLAAVRPSTRIPPGAKSGSAVALASLLVGLSGAPASKALLNGIFSWLGPRKGEIKISCSGSSIELSAATPAERDRLIEWLQACTEQSREDPPGRHDERSS